MAKTLAAGKLGKVAADSEQIQHASGITVFDLVDVASDEDIETGGNSNGLDQKSTGRSVAHRLFDTMTESGDSIQRLYVFDDDRDDNDERQQAGAQD